MNSKLVMGLVGTLIIGLGSFNVYQYTSYNNKVVEYETMVQELTLNQGGDSSEGAILSSVVGMVNEVKQGSVIQPDDVTVLNLPEAVVPESAVASADEVIGKVARIDLMPNTMLIDSLVADRKYTNTTKQRQVYFDYATTDVSEGDFVDIRLAYPDGSDYVVLPYMQIQKAKGKYIEILMDEGEYALYKGMCVDYLTSKDYGVKIYIDKYLDPLIQVPVKQTYVVPEKIQQYVEANPNIVDKVIDSNNEATREEIRILNESLGRTGDKLIWEEVQPQGEIKSSDESSTSNELVAFGS